MARDKRLFAFGVRLAARRTARGFSQEELAHRAHLGPQYVSTLERGRANPSLLVLLDLARALGVDPGSLLTDRSSTGADVAALLEEQSPVAQRKARAVLRALLETK